MKAADTLSVSSPVFAPDGTIPLCCTGFGEDVSPPLHLSGLCKGAVSLAVTMVDLDIPLLREYPHWLIWNLSPTQEIPAAIPPGESLPELHDAAQGVAYGVHRYRGPKPPLWVRNTHRYRFDVYVLNCRLALDSQPGQAERSAQGDEGTHPAVGKFDRKVPPLPAVWKQDADGRKIDIKGRIIYGKNSAAAGAAQ